MPANPAAWLHAAAMRKAIDRKRRAATAQRALTAQPVPEQDELDPHALPDERLSLIFTCCHPALSLEARVALTLRMVGGLATPEIARLFLVQEATMAARLTRAKHKIRAARIPFAEPSPAERVERLGGVLATVYLIFTEGYAASAGESLIRTALAEEAIRLGALLHALDPDQPEVASLLALMLFQHARRDARVGADGALVLLRDQDRARWRHDEIARARSLMPTASSDPGPCELQALIAAEHCRQAAPDWPAIARLYARLERLTGSPVVRLNRAVAVAEADGPEAGLALLDGLDELLPGHRQLPLARGELLARLGRSADAARELAAALALASNEVERRHIAARIAQVEG